VAAASIIAKEIAQDAELKLILQQLQTSYVNSLKVQDDILFKTHCVVIPASLQPAVYFESYMQAILE